MLASVGLIGPAYGLDWLTFPLNSGGLTAIYINPQAPANVSQQVDDMVNFLASSPEFHIRQIYDKNQIEQVEAFKGAYVMLEVDFTFGMNQHVTGPIFQPGGRGQHGYSPLRPEMYASFLVQGPIIRDNYQIDLVHLIDVAPTIAYILGLPPSFYEGRVVQEVFNKFL